MKPAALASKPAGLSAPLALLLAAMPAHAGGSNPPPDWVAAAAHAPAPVVAPTAKAVILDEEETLTVGADGKAVKHVRRVLRILRQSGRSYASVVIPVNQDEKLRFVHVWSIAADGHPYSLRDNEFVEVGNDEYGILYNDLRLHIARAPAADPGAVIAYEYEQSTRPYVQEFNWDYQNELPRVHSAFELNLPADWRYSVAMRDGAAIHASQPGPNRYRWQIDNVPAIDMESVPMAPSPYAVGGRMVVRYSHGPQPSGDARWTAVGDWYTTLAGPRAQSTPEMAAKAQALTAGQTDFTQQVASIASYLQRNIRYVGIEIGIGGLQPHPASDVFRYHYGDCKDKATLLRAMLEPLGIHVAWVLVDTERGIVDPQLPSARGNHMITAIQLPKGYSNPALQSVVTTASGTRYLIFDPTDEWTPFGQIRPDLQGGYGILGEGSSSQLILPPRLAPADDTVEHTIHARLTPDGALQATVVEQRFGSAANASRAAFAEGSEQKQHDLLEKRLRHDLSSFAIESVSAAHPTDLMHPFEIDYSFRAPGYARTAGNMLLVRPRVLGTDSLPLPREPRTFPVELGAIQTRRDHIDLALPQGYVVDELPDPVTLDTDFASYHSSVTAEGTTLRYTREYTVKKLELEAARYDELRTFHERIAYDEATTAVLKKQ